MSSPFDLWNLQDAKIAAQLATEQTAQLASYRAAVAGDHWQDWKWWTGPIPDPADPDYQVLSEGITRGFVSRNVLGECVGRAVNGVLGRDIKWSWVTRRKLKKNEQPNEDEQARIDEATDLATQWVETRKLNQEYDKLGENLLVEGMAYQRPFVAPGAVDENGIVPQADLPTSLGRVYFNFPLRGEAVVWTDPRTQQKCSIYLYRQVTSSRPSQAANQQGDERAELTYLDGDQTIIRIVGADTESIDPNGFTYPLGKRILMADMARKPLLNEQVASQQKLLNKTLSQMARNGDMAGFRERVVYNARMGGTLVKGEDGEERFVADPLNVGPSSMIRLTGYKTIDADGSEKLNMPGMDWIDPVPVATFLEAAQAAYEAILGEMNQLHYSMSADATASGTSRQTAMAAYLIDLLQTKQQIDAGWSWLLETALALASTLAGVPGRFDDLKVVAECSVDPGPISSEMLIVTSNLIRETQLSHRTGLVWMGVDEPDAEIAAIQKEQAEAEARQGPDLAGVQSLLDGIRGGVPPGTSNGRNSNGVPAPANGKPEPQGVGLDA